MRTRHAVRTFAGSALPLPHASCPCAQRFVSLCQRHVRHLRREIAVSVRKWVSSKLAERNSKRDRWNFRNVTGSFAPGKLRENDEIAICIFIINVLRDFHQLRVTPSWRAGVPVSFFLHLHAPFDHFWSRDFLIFQSVRSYRKKLTLDVNCDCVLIERATSEDRSSPIIKRYSNQF